jgi:hypothetical protein
MRRCENQGAKSGLHAKLGENLAAGASPRPSPEPTATCSGEGCRCADVTDALRAHGRGLGDDQAGRSALSIIGGGERLAHYRPRGCVIGDITRRFFGLNSPRRKGRQQMGGTSPRFSRPAQRSGLLAAHDL